MEIPKTMSAPLVKGLPSFLDLPAEIRILVYEQLFKRGGPVLIHDVRAYYAQKPRAAEHTLGLLDTGDGPTTSDRTVPLAWDEQLDSEKEELKSFDHGLDEGFGLLKSCRQIYRESAAVMYGDNKFVVSRVFKRHDYSEYNNDYSHFGVGTYQQLHYYPVWLRSLGTQHSLLQNVEIDMAATCPYGCDSGTTFNVLPILRFIWDHPSAKWNLTLKPTRETLISGQHWTSKEDELDDISRSCQFLSRTLLSLGHNDGLQLERFASSKILLKGVIIQRGELEGYVIFHQGHDFEDAFRTFEAISDGSVHWQPTKKPDSYVNSLPEKIRKKIQILATTSPDGLFVDLDSRIVRGFDFSLFKVARKFLGSSRFSDRDTIRAERTIGDNVPVTMQMSSPEPITSFEGFKGLWNIGHEREEYGTYTRDAACRTGSSMIESISLTTPIVCR